MKPAAPMAERGLEAASPAAPARPRQQAGAGSIIRAAEAGTLPGLFRERATRSPEARAYAWRDPGAAGWREITWSEVRERVRRVEAALEGQGLGKGDRVGLLLPNGIDWVSFDLAALGLGLVVVPLYLRDSPVNVGRILRATGARLVVVDTLERWSAVVAAAGCAPAVEQVWVAEAVPATPGGQVRRLGEVLPKSAPSPAPIRATADDTATIIFTSGTTGEPKGVMLTHAALLWNAEAVAKVIAPVPDDVFLSILPLAHAFERTVGHYLPMMAGATVAYARSPELLAEDLLAVRPTVLLAVPRLYERICAAIEAAAQGSPLQQWLLRLTADVGWSRFRAARGLAPPPRAGSRAAQPILRRLVGQRALGAFGGRLRVAVSGGAALPEEVARRLVGLGLPLVEGYGLTEAGPVVTGTPLEDYWPGSVGRALDGVELKLSQRGELLVRSPGLMRGYWNAAEATAAAFQDGWLRTGDLAEIRQGRVFIAGRLKEIIVLATGEKLDPEPIEAAMQRDPLIEQACVLGEGRPFAVAVVALNAQRWRRLAAELAIDAGRPNARAAKADVLGRIARHLVPFPRFSQIRDVHLVVGPWTVEQGLLTPTLKVKRRAVAAAYAEAIARLYSPDAAWT